VAQFEGKPIPNFGTGEALSWQVEARGGDRMVVQLRGEINENADFTELKRQLRGEVMLLLDGITRINSCGVREWVNFVRELEEVGSLVFARCAPTVVMQLNAIYNFRGRARVQSFLAPYVCEPCRVDEYRLLDVAEHFPNRSSTNVPSFPCPRCGRAMQFDELPERYLAFLAEPERTGGG
jgi:hypothetical protein